MGLTVRLTGWHPRLDVVLKHLALSHITGAHVDDTVRELKQLHNLLSVTEKLHVKLHALFRIGLTESDLLNLVELMHTVESVRVLSVRARFTAVAR